MDTQKLKACAERLRAHLEQHHLTLKHGQALDLVASIPGLRNWPEIIAFPALVTAGTWDSHSADRLAKRISKLYGLNIPVAELHQALKPAIPDILKVWPDGPMPGIYLTTSSEAIDAAIAKYENATDGALLYAEQTGTTSDSAIELGEYGLYSNGMDRLPSGTLVVVGPVSLTQESWSDNKNRMNVAANLAYSSKLRIVVLAKTPLLDNLHSDFDLLLRSEDEGFDIELSDVLGIVTELGELQVVRPFVQRRMTPQETQRFTTNQRLPKALKEALRKAVEKRPFGIIALGVTPRDKTCDALMEAIMPLTTYAGPAVRIQPTFRPSYGKDNSLLSQNFEGIPVFPSIESAHAHGYRRMVVESPHHGESEAMLNYLHDTCFIVGSNSTNVADLWMDAMPQRQEWPNGLESIIALLCIADIKTEKEVCLVCDAFITGEAVSPDSKQIDELIDHLESSRIIRWQNQLDILLATDRVTSEQAKKALRRHDVESHLAALKATQA